ncbi:hypothetical protein [Nocardioides sp. REDSEA-S30_B4]|jgi:hypothetical protein|nr:hypothetical protein [Nocardioides sp. REDSEA-S30_B4]
MMGTQMTAGGSQDLVQVWTTVTGIDGSPRLESRWTTAELAAAMHATHAA